MKIYVGSLQYSPIYKSHCCAFGNQCEKQGHDVKYLFSSEYEWMLPPAVIKKTLFVGNSLNITTAIKDSFNLINAYKIKNILSQDKPDYIYMHNVHPFFNRYIAKLAKKLGIVFIQHVHEPYVENKSVYGGVHQYILYLFEYLQQNLLVNTDVAVLSSTEALSLFNKRYPHYSGKKVMVPLIYEDLGKHYVKNMDHRKYITFIGPPSPAKGEDLFLQLIDYSENHKLKLEFLLISRAKINDKRFLNHNNLIIYHHNNISDDDFGKCLEKSLLTLVPYKTVRQSSTVLTSYMHGTPVLSSNVGGLLEVVNHKENGYLVDLNSSVEDWIAGIEFIKNDIQKISDSCRKYFETNFSENNWDRYFQEIFIKTSNNKL